jgi:hypothetical protein
MKQTIPAIFIIICLFISCSKTENIEPEREKGGIISYTAGAEFQNKTIPVHYFIPIGDVSTMKVQFVFHGVERNAREYIAAWTQKAREYNLILIAPEFSTALFNTGEYNEGGAIVGGKLNDPDKMTFALVDKIFDYVKNELKFNQSKYNMYGHSAGAQFVHRSLQFFDSPNLDIAVAANSGWYTYPDENISYPYGIKSLIPDAKSFRKNFYKKKLYIFIGDQDTSRSGDLRTTSQADQQGLNRLQRGNNFFTSNMNLAQSESTEFSWQLKIIAGVGHDHTKMSAATADFLYK